MRRSLTDNLTTFSPWIGTQADPREQADAFVREDGRPEPGNGDPLNLKEASSRATAEAIDLAMSAVSSSQRSER